MRKYLLPLLAALLAAAATTSFALADQGRDGREHDDGNAHANSAYAIGLWGDLPYNAEQTATGVPNIIADMNAQKLAFVVHDGDIKSGSSECSNDVYARALGYFNSITSPAMYTPGDNEWTDCDRNPKYTSRERLEYLRSQFFSAPYSFGQHRIRLEQQEAPYVENRRWRIGRVQYATLHVVGSNNNLGDVAPDPAEYEARDRATNAWMRDTFKAAKSSGASAVMLVAQANPGFDRNDPLRAPKRNPQSLIADPDPANPGNGFDNFIRALREETVKFGKPVVLVHGDSHYPRVDKPLLNEKGQRLENFTRVETFGDNAQNGNNDAQWLKVTVDPRSREVFAFQPQIVPANRVAVPAP